MWVCVGRGGGSVGDPLPGDTDACARPVPSGTKQKCKAKGKEESPSVTCHGRLSLQQTRWQHIHRGPLHLKSDKPSIRPALGSGVMPPDVRTKLQASISGSPPPPVDAPRWNAELMHVGTVCSQYKSAERNAARQWPKRP